VKLLVDMNLSPQWIAVLREAGHVAVHWSTVGDPRASDHQVMTWARDNKHVVFTHDLDFGAILAASKVECPSVIQLRTQNVNPHHVSNLIISALDQLREQLEKGALVTIDEMRSRARILPIDS